MTSKAAKLRRARERRERFITLAGGHQMPQPAKQGRRSDLEDPRAVTETVATARVRRSGVVDTQEALQPLCGTDLGLCVRYLATGQERQGLEQTWKAISASRENYCARYIGKKPIPQNVAIGMVPEPVETDPSLRVDLRTAEEKDRAAKVSWATWEARIKALPFGLKWIMEGVLFGFMGEAVLWKDQRPTEKGRLAVEALRRIME